jgi:hypothetical protein
LFRDPVSTNTLLEELFASLRMPYQIETAAMISAISMRRSLCYAVRSAVTQGWPRLLRRVPTEKVVLAELAEAQRRLEATLANPGLPEATAAYIANAYHSLRETAQQWTQRKAGQLEVTREMLTTHPQRNSCRHERPPAAWLAPAPASLTAARQRLGQAISPPLIQL